MYAIAFELVSHTDSAMDESRRLRFVRGYQTESTLSSGALWALPIMLRVCLVENLRRLATQVATAQHQREEAQEWAERLLAVAAEDADALSEILEERGTEREALEPPFAVQLMQWLRDQGPPSIPIVNWLEEQLARQGATYDNLIRQVHQTEAVNLVSGRELHREPSVSVRLRLVGVLREHESA